MANIERLRNVEQQITSSVDEITNEFKQRVQSILSDNQLSLSKNIKQNDILIFNLFSFVI